MVDCVTDGQLAPIAGAKLEFSKIFAGGDRIIVDTERERGPRARTIVKVWRVRELRIDDPQQRPA